MKEIVTAINNPLLNEELKKEKYIKIIGKDIQYKEGIIELLEKNKNIDIIIISENLPGEIEEEALIKKINIINEKIKIIYILEKEKTEKEKILNKLKINDIYYNNKITIKEIIKIIKNNEINKEEEMREEIEKLKKIIEEKENKEKNKTKIIKLFNKNLIEKNIKKTRKINKKIKVKKQNKISNKIINIIGNKNTGKTTVAILIGNILSKKQKNILFIDLDDKKDLTKKILNINYKINKKNNSKIKNKININTKEKINKKIKLNKNKIKINNKKIKKYKNKNINYRKNKSIKKYLKKFFNKKFNSPKKRKIKLKKIENKKIKDLKKYRKEIIKIKDRIFLLNKYNEKSLQRKVDINELFFDYIIVDTSYNNKEEIVKKLIKKSNKNIIVANGNTLGVKDLQENIEKGIKNREFNTKSLHIIINKVNRNTVSKEILKKIFNPIRIIMFIKDKKEKQNLIKKKIELKNLEREILKK